MLRQALAYPVQLSAEDKGRACLINEQFMLQRRRVPIPTSGMPKRVHVEFTSKLFGKKCERRSDLL